MFRSISKLLRRDPSTERAQAKVGVFFETPNGGILHVTFAEVPEGQQALTPEMVKAQVRQDCSYLVPIPEWRWDNFEIIGELKDPIEKRYGTIGYIAKPVGYSYHIYDHETVLDLQNAVLKASHQRSHFYLAWAAGPSTYASIDLKLEKFSNEGELKLINNLEKACPQLNRINLTKPFSSSWREPVVRDGVELASIVHPHVNGPVYPPPQQFKCVRDTVFRTAESIHAPKLFPTLVVVSALGGSSLLLAGVLVCWLYKRHHRANPVENLEMQNYGALGAEVENAEVAARMLNHP